MSNFIIGDARYLPAPGDLVCWIKGSCLLVVATYNYDYTRKRNSKVFCLWSITQECHTKSVSLEQPDTFVISCACRYGYIRK